MKRLLLSILFIGVLLLSACGAPTTAPASHRHKEGALPREEVAPSEEPRPTQAPQAIPINVTLEYFGVKCNHDGEDVWDPDGEIQLLILITDGKEISQVSLPPDETGFKMGHFEVKRLHQPIFHTASVGEYLKLQILAYDIDSKEKTMSYLEILEAFGIPEASLLRQLYAMLPQEDDRVGYYERTWYPEDDWGIGQHAEVGVGDLRVWFSIWSDTEPAPPSKPSLFLPGKFNTFLAGFPLFYTGKLYFEGEVHSGDVINVSVRQIPPFDNEFWRNWGVIINDPQGEKVKSITENESISCSFSHTAESDGLHTITIWNSGYGFNAEIQFEPKKWKYVGNNGHGSKLLCCE